MGKQGNQWAYLTNFTVNIDRIDTTVFGDNHRSSIGGMGMINFNGVAPATPQILEAMKKWMYGGNARLPVFADEWLCLYCGSPNALPAAHCSQCGAPRNWLIG